jgi:membrane protease YdiL (CAAX protease family)
VSSLDRVTASGGAPDAAVRHPQADWRRRHAAAFVLGAFMVFEAIHVAIAWSDARIIRSALPWLPDDWLGPVVWGCYAVIALALVAALGWWRAVGLTRLGRRGTLAVLAYPFATGLVFLVLGVHLDRSQVVPVLLVGAPLIALNEEVFFRGFALEGLRPLGWRAAIVGSAALFGAAHTVNVISGANLPFTIMQVAATTAGAITLAAIRIRTGSLWPAIALHLGLDIVALATLTAAGVSSPILVPVLVAWLVLNLSLWWYGWRLLHGRTHDELDRLYAGRD